jgi:hypothetical protein
MNTQNEKPTAKADREATENIANTQTETVKKGLNLVKLEVEDANRDKYNLEFEVTPMGDVVCPLCGAEIPADGACAQGHIAYTITDPDATEKVNDSLRGEA